MGSTQLCNISWDKFDSSLSHTAQSLHRVGDFVDVTLSAGGKIFPAHKLVLSSASPLLMELLKSTNCKHPVIMLAGVSSDDLEALLHFIYHGEVSVDPARISSLLQAAECLDIQALSPSILTSDKVSAVTNPESDHLGGSKEIASPHFPLKRKREKIKMSPTSGKSKTSDTEDGDQSHYQNFSYDYTGKNGPGFLELSFSVKKPTLISDLPVTCSICGATIRQSRNLRRHMELIHMKQADGSVRSARKKNKKKVDDLVVNSSPPLSTTDSNSDMGENGISIVTMASRLVSATLDENSPGSSQPTSDPLVPSLPTSLSQSIPGCRSSASSSMSFVSGDIHPIFSHGHMLAPDPLQHSFQQQPCRSDSFYQTGQDENT